MANEIAITEEKALGFLHESVTGIARSLGRVDFRTAELVQGALIAVMEKKELRECLLTDAGRSSLKHALRYAVSTGLSLNPQEGNAALIAYDGEVSYQVMKNGLTALLMQTGKVQWITAEGVREKDDFRVRKTGAGDDFEFSPSLRDRGDLIGFFAAVKFIDGTLAVKYMTVEQVNERKEKYSRAWKYTYTDSKNSPPRFKTGDPKPEAAWVKSFEGMGIKTVIKALCDSITLPGEVKEALRVEDAQWTEPAPRDVTPEKGTSPEKLAEKIAEPAPVAAEPKPEPAQRNDLF